MFTLDDGTRIGMKYWATVVDVARDFAKKADAEDIEDALYLLDIAVRALKAAQKGNGKKL